ncbi:MAG: glycosyltransferase family 4 protein [Polaromonas sp.]|uniref:glycosyltransferase family 4 protein n=1 Tax=Polaromonas sp. TaxID=1869339 RepID=UPI0025F18339|nr:glycosyltransferase family 4 protein [Polaromonas sp.]MBI2725926.1 glycosyltransferase family 4 protein [Polaromonas sp.]
MSGPETKSGRRRKLLFFVTEDWYFCSHRLPPARAALAAGYEVVVATRVDRRGEQIAAEGFRVVPLSLSRRSRNPLQELAAVMEIVRIYWQERPDIVHHVALKPVLYGSVAALLLRRPAVVNAMAGMGFLFTSSSRSAGWLRAVVSRVFRVLLNAGRNVLILQNPDDVNLMVSGGLVQASRVRLIRGSGVDTQRFHPAPEPDGIPVVMLASRMLWDKGVGEFVEAARQLRDRGVHARFVLVGDGDPDNPASIPDEQLKLWHDSGVAECWGRCEDMPGAFAQAHIVCLPSYREGLPKVLLEAAACGLPLVATDAPGCREIVRHGENGLLVPLRDATALALAIERLLADSALRASMGKKGRRMVEEEFSEAYVAGQTLAVYREMCAP